MVYWIIMGDDYRRALLGDVLTLLADMAPTSRLYWRLLWCRLSAKRIIVLLDGLRFSGITTS